MATESIYTPVVIRGRQAHKRLVSAMAESERRVKALNAAQTPKTTYRRMTDDEVAKWFGDIQKQH